MRNVIVVGTVCSMKKNKQNESEKTLKMKNLIKSVTSELCKIKHYDTTVTTTDGIRIKIVFEKDGDICQRIIIQKIQLKYPIGTTYKIFTPNDERCELIVGALEDVCIDFNVCTANATKKGMFLIIEYALCKDRINSIKCEYEFNGETWIEKEKKS